MARVIIIDDNDTMREGMAVTLKKSGHEVLAFRSGTDGLAAYEKSPADLVLTDLKMDVMDGIQVVTRLKVLDPNAVAVMVTAFGTIEVAVEAMKHGAADFLTKPFTPEVLRAKVESALELSRARAQVAKLRAHHEVLTSDATRGQALVGESELIRQLLE